MKTAFITGANKSIGLATARQLGKTGYHIFLGSRSLQNGETAARQLAAEGIQVTVIQADIANKDSVEKAQAEIAAKTDHLDTLINNAGILGKLPQPPSQTDPETILEVFDTNFFGTIRTTQAFLGLLRAAAAPRIVNVTSDLASLTRHSDPGWKYYSFKGAAYGPSKTALNAYTLALAYELRDTAFKVNCVNPGYTATDFNNYRGEKSPEQAAKIIVKFATLDASGPTGKFYSEEGETPW
ncbi:MAG TPA: SDR family oxidoreductase [Puia sp.]|nr:SDR family oxidoreductase [Puia sp.]